MRISFFPTPAHRTFHYEPRFYDERKEKMKERYEKYGKEYPDGAQATDAAEKADSPAMETSQKNAENKEFVSARDRYIPGRSIRGAFQAELERNRKQAGNAKVKKVIMLITIAAALIAAYYLAEGFVELLR